MQDKTQPLAFRNDIAENTSETMQKPWPIRYLLATLPRYEYTNDLPRPLKWRGCSTFLLHLQNANYSYVLHLAGQKCIPIIFFVFLLAALFVPHSVSQLQ